MGAARIDAAVIDAGPLIHLNEIGCLSILTIFETLHLPDAVWSETVERKRVLDTDILKLGNVHRQSVNSGVLSQFVIDHSLQDIHAGERECLCLCQHLSVPLILTDDLAVRQTAKRLNITPVGSLGIVVKAFRLNQISLAEAERHIANLQDISTLFVTKAVVELAIEQLHLKT
jgi:predicted nucleic acid-binding protein